MSDVPPFWFQKPGLAAWLLAPFGALYGRAVGLRVGASPKFVASVPVICVGNFVVGGAGKTPTALALAKVAKKMGHKPGFLSRGYGGGATHATLVDPDTHNARDVGDEPLLLAAKAPTVVSIDRPSGAELLAEQDVDLIIMDDGFQNPHLKKDFTLVVVDAERGIGNGFCMPAGPLRANLSRQLSMTDALLIVGQSDVAANLVRRVAKMARPIIQANIRLLGASKFKNKKILAWCGIAAPQKFFGSLEKVGAKIMHRRAFDDHHPLGDDECNELLELAQAENLILASTAKDIARLQRMGDAQQKLLDATVPLNIELEFENVRMIEQIIARAIDHARSFKLGL